MPATAEDYDLTDDCEPDCSCYRTDCPELFCEKCNRVLPLEFIKERWPEFNGYCQCAGN